MISFLNNPSYSRGLRNNNPGNLVLTGIPWSGKIPVAQNTDGTFEQFTTANYGIRAMAMDLMNDFGEGTDTLSKLITEFSPPHENNTGAYINYVAGLLGINPDAELVMNADALSLLLQAQIRMENGDAMAALLPVGEIEESIMLMPAAILAELGTFVKENKGAIVLGTVLGLGGMYGVYRLVKYLA